MQYHHWELEGQIYFNIFRYLGIFLSLVILSVFGADLTAETVFGAIALAGYGVICSIFLLCMQSDVYTRSALEKENEQIEYILTQEQKRFEAFRAESEYLDIKCHDLKHQIHKLKEHSAVSAETIAELESGIAVYVSYNEGIYADYKYYETRYEDCVLGAGTANSTAGTYASGGGWNYAEEVLYSYGYGLSYTTFEKEIVGIPSFNDTNQTATVTVKVTNTGSTAGKEVVQLYAQAPYTQYDIDNRVEKAAVQLMGFEKTPELDPGDSVTLEILANLQWLASYDYTNARTYIMDAGDYYFSVGGSP